MFTKYFLSICVLISFLFIQTRSFGFEYYDYDKTVPSSEVILKEGTFIKVVNLREINSSVADIGDRVEFLNKSDMFMGEFNAIPANSKFRGKIVDIREPVQGNNGAIKIQINEIETPDNLFYYPEAFIYSANDNYLGGEQTPVLYYRKVPHYQKGYKNGMLQYAPTNILEQGKPTKIKAGSELFVIFLKDLKIN